MEIGKVNEPWDIGVMPMPENPPLQVLLIEKADHETEAGGRTPTVKAAISRLRAEMTRAGVLIQAHALAPSSRGKRLLFRKNALTTMDGPFAESKELIGGFAVLDLSGMDEAIEVSTSYAEILGGTLEVDVRVMVPLED